ncbi:MAG: ATPase domain-containing protein [Candidatus Altiarchaeota archaeon]
MVERISSGIPGLDEMIEGGFKKHSTVLIVGGCGSGKSTLAMQYLYQGALAGEPGVYVTFEEEADSMRDNMSRHGWDLKKMEDSKKLKIMRIEPQDVIHIIKQEYGGIVDAINDLGARRVVIDSLTSIETMIEGDFEKRQGVLKLMNWLQKSKCTSLMIAESEQDPTKYSRHGIMEFVVDGVIVLYNVRRGKSRIRALEVLKMRGTNQITNLVPYVIDKGIILQPRQMIFGDFTGQQG